MSEGTTTMTEVTQEAPRPQDHWLVVGAIKAARALIKAADDLSFAAQITGGTAGRDAALCAAVAQWVAERDKQKQMLRIIEIEGDDPAIGAGFELCPSPLTTAQAEAEALRKEVEALRATGTALLAAIDQMIDDTTHIFAEMELVRGRPYTGRQIGPELAAFRAALERKP